ncbi:hypothetical protein POM88_003335 [Heracleum sosnowskyi]|uniref:Uncharacterized protein n=1 Tax=Heracleum sosnowskyi TaxID=360622 RepID=A0AAD8JFR1_9APIA|nr:hypothetical protein POM88_003335 [Heracleum sosnowskyi]
MEDDKRIIRILFLLMVFEFGATASLWDALTCLVALFVIAGLLSKHGLIGQSSKSIQHPLLPHFLVCVISLTSSFSFVEARDKDAQKVGRSGFWMILFLVLMALGAGSSRGGRGRGSRGGRGKGGRGNGSGRGSDSGEGRGRGGDIDLGRPVNGKKARAKLEHVHHSGAMPFDERREEDKERVRVTQSTETLSPEGSTSEPPSSPGTLKKIHRKKEMCLTIQAIPPKKGKAIIHPRQPVAEVLGAYEAARLTASQSTPSQQISDNSLDLVLRVSSEVYRMVRSLEMTEVPC